MANLKMSLVGEGLLKPGNLQAWTKEKQQRIHAGTKRAMVDVGRDLARQADNQARSALKIRKKNFPNIRAKVYDAKPGVLPALRIYSRVPWLGIHARGGVVTGRKGKMLIPLIDIGQRAFKRVVDTVIRTGAGFFKEVNGKVLLFAEYQPEYGRPFAKFRRAERERLGGGRIKRGQDIPIAVVVSQVSIRKRIDMAKIVKAGLPTLARRIEQYI
jgi:hypothetical protein